MTKKKVAKTTKTRKKTVATKKKPETADGLMAMLKKNAEADAKKMAKENAPADKLMTKLEKFCEKNKIRMWGTVDMYGLGKIATRPLNVNDLVTAEGLKGITRQEL